MRVYRDGWSPQTDTTTAYKYLTAWGDSFECSGKRAWVSAKWVWNRLLNDEFANCRRLTVAIIVTSRCASVWSRIRLWRSRSIALEYRIVVRWCERALASNSFPGCVSHFKERLSQQINTKRNLPNLFAFRFIKHSRKHMTWTINW